MSRGDGRAGRAASAARAATPEGVAVGSFEDAARHEVVVIAVPHEGSIAVAARLAPLLRDSLVLDAMNAERLDDGRPVSGLDAGLAEGERLSRLLPASTVARAFSHLPHELLASRGRDQPGLWAVGYAVDDAAASSLVERLIADVGYAPVHVGSLAQSTLLDPGGAAFLRLLTRVELEGLAAAHRLPEMVARFNTATIGEVLHEDVLWRFPSAPTIGLAERVEGREAVSAHLARVQASGVRISDIRTELETTHGAVLRITGSFPTRRGTVTSPIVAVVTVRDGLIGEVHEHWDTAAFG